MSASTDNKTVSVITKEGVLVVKQTNFISPLYCPLCERIIKTQLDAQEFQSYQCCYYCSLKWAQSNSKKWAEGWRPSQKEIKEEVDVRKERNLIVSYKPILFK